MPKGPIPDKGVFCGASEQHPSFHRWNCGCAPSLSLLHGSLYLCPRGSKLFPHQPTSNVAYKCISDTLQALSVDRLNSCQVTGARGQAQVHQIPGLLLLAPVTRQLFNLTVRWGKSPEEGQHREQTLLSNRIVVFKSYCAQKWQMKTQPLRL